MVKNNPTIHAEISRSLEPVFLASSNVLAAVLFGSSAKGDHTGKSDVDIAVYVREPKNFSLRDRLALHGDCCRSLKRNDVDLIVMNQLSNMILLEHIVRDGIVIYSVDRDELDSFMVTMLHKAIDFRDQRDRAMQL